MQINSGIQGNQIEAFESSERAQLETDEELAKKLNEKFKKEEEQFQINAPLQADEDHMLAHYFSRPDC